MSVPFNIRHKDFRACVLLRNACATWILKRGGLDSSGQRLISLNRKTKRRAFFWRKNIFSKSSDFKKICFFRLFSQDRTGELGSNLVFVKIIFQISQINQLNSDFLKIFEIFELFANM